MGGGREGRRESLGHTVATATKEIKTFGCSSSLGTTTSQCNMRCISQQAVLGYSKGTKINVQW